MTGDVAEVTARFAVPGRLVSATPLGRGHINSTWLAEHEHEGRRLRHVVQRVNRTVFPRPVELMENMARVSGHLRAKLEAEGATDLARRTIALVPARDGGLHHLDTEGELWRAYRHVGGARTHPVTDDPRVARAAARAIGAFLARLADLPGPRLHDTIPGFHDTPGRFTELRRAVEEDPCGRLDDARPEVELALDREPAADALVERAAAGELPERVVHNDAKIDNVLVDDATGEGLCVLDLDTVMPGLAPYDFGELVRSATNPVRESDRNLPGVTMRMEMFEAVARGFLEGAGDRLGPGEADALVDGARLMALENGVRFLADHLRGDVYFPARRPGQNLDRARVQLRLLRSIERQEEGMREVVSRMRREVSRRR